MNSLKELEVVRIDLDHYEQTMRIGTQITLEIHAKLIEVLRAHKKTFAWFMDDMVGINSEVITHKFEVNRSFSLVCQRR